MWKPFDKQHGKRAKALLKFASQHIYLVRWPLPIQLSWKKFLFLTCQILGLLVNTLPADEDNPVLNRYNLTIDGIQMELYKKQNIFLIFFLDFWNLQYILNILNNETTLIDFLFPKLRPAKTLSEKCLKSPVSEDPSTSNMINMLKHCWNLNHCTFILLIDHWKFSLVGKSLIYWHAKSWDCLLTHWLPMNCILFIRETL